MRLSACTAVTGLRELSCWVPKGSGDQKTGSQRIFEHRFQYFAPRGNYSYFSAAGTTSLHRVSGMICNMAEFEGLLLVLLSIDVVNHLGQSYIPIGAGSLLMTPIVSKKIRTLVTFCTSLREAHRLRLWKPAELAGPPAAPRPSWQPPQPDAPHRAARARPGSEPALLRPRISSPRHGTQQRPQPAQGHRLLVHAQHTCCDKPPGAAILMFRGLLHALN